MSRKTYDDPLRRIAYARNLHELGYTPPEPRLHRLVTICRGPSGCGKSTWIDAQIENLKEQDRISFATVSADRFFLRGTSVDDCISSEHALDPKLLGEAHAWCFGEFLDHLEAKIDVIFVDNTNIRAWEYAHYEKAARMEGYTVHFQEFISPSTTIAQVAEWAERNTHGTPADVVFRMAREFEPR